MMDSQDSSAVSLTPVGFWARTLATLFDTALELVAIAVLLSLAKAEPNAATGQAGDPTLAFVIEYLLPFAATVLLWARYQATPGKIAIQAYIIDARTGGKPSTGQFVIRYLGYLVALLPLGLGFLWVAFDKRKQGWHDKMAGTLVVRRQPEPAPLPSFPDLASTGIPIPVPAFSPAGAPMRPVRAATHWGPWANVEARENEASLVWLGRDELHLAVIGPAELPGCAAAVAGGAYVPSLAVPYEAVHRIEGAEDTGELAVTFGNAGGVAETMSARLRDGNEREQLLTALLARLGPGWSRVREQESRWRLSWSVACLMGLTLLLSLWLQWAAADVPRNGMPEVYTEDSKHRAIIMLLYAAAGLLGPDAVRVIGNVVMGLCALALLAVLVAPPARVVIRRSAEAWDPRWAAASR